MEMNGERQIAPTTSGIRRDHVARYEWAARTLPARSRVVDMACGVGYGTQILKQAGHNATGFDKCPEAIAYARKFYPAAEYRMAADECPLRAFDAVVCFETIEHVDDPARLLRSFWPAQCLLASVPNEDVVPFGAGFAWHKRHYTREQFRQLLEDNGWTVAAWWGQEGTESEVVRDMDGRTLIAVCLRKGEPVDAGRDGKAAPTIAVERDEDEAPDPEFVGYEAGSACGLRALADQLTPGQMRAANLPVPEHVAIIGLGGSKDQYLDIATKLGGRHAYCDEVWGINAAGAVLQCDRVFHMDDPRTQVIRANARPESNIAAMVREFERHPGPIYTSVPHREWPGTVALPVEDIVNHLQIGYFNSTAAWAVAYAITIGVKRISLFGCDFSYADSHVAEKGRANVEFLLGWAAAKGIRITVSQWSTLMDARDSQADRLYGFDWVDVTIRTEGNRICLDMVDKTIPPTADEIEARYDHSRPVAEQTIAGA